MHFCLQFKCALFNDHLILQTINLFQRKCNSINNSYINLLQKVIQIYNQKLTQ